MEVRLLQRSELSILIKAIRVCHASLENSDSTFSFSTGFVLGDKDRVLIKNILKAGHESTLEHLIFTFSIKEISRGCLQELVRHRIASYSVQSTRYTIKKLLADENRNLEDFLVSSGNRYIDTVAVEQLEEIRFGLDTSQLPNDRLKYALPEAFKTDLIMTINARSLRNFFNLRLSKEAHFEIRNLAFTMLNEIPDEYDIIFKDVYSKYLENVREVL